MKNLEQIAGLPLLFDPQALHFAFDAGTRDPLYGTRLPGQMRKVLLDQDSQLPDIIYWMLRDTGLKDRPYLKDTKDLRYDISIFRHDNFGREYMKTSGHYHPLQPNSEIAWPEVYEVIDGKALWLLQKVKDINAGPDEAIVEDVIIVEGLPGDKVIMPPNYGHVTINTTEEPLVMSNWVSSQFSSAYKAVEAARGFAYYYLHGDGKPRWVKNPLYKQPLPPLRKAVGRETPALGLTRGKPLLLSALDDPDRFDFLNNPAGNMELIWQGLEIVGEVEVGEL